VVDGDSGVAWSMVGKDLFKCFCKSVRSENKFTFDRARYIQPFEDYSSLTSARPLRESRGDVHSMDLRVGASISCVYAVYQNFERLQI
jgi:hypothetical protein